MNYYKFNIGDYAAATRHLSMLEHGAYRLLLDVYYTAEQPLPADVKAAARKAGARSKDEIAAVEVVLGEFFELTPDGWIQGRCDAEIALYQAKAETNRVIGRRGGRPKKETQTVSDGNPEITQTVSEINPTVTLNTNQEPLTTNQEPIKTHSVVLTEAGEHPNLSVSRQSAICMVIKAEGIGSVNPQHPELLSLIDQGADVGHFAAAARVAKDKGKGFAYLLGVVRGQMADAVKLANAQPAQATPGTRPQPESFKERDDRTARTRWEEMTGRTHPDNLPAAPTNVDLVVDISPRFLEESST